MRINNEFLDLKETYIDKISLIIDTEYDSSLLSEDWKLDLVKFSTNANIVLLSLLLLECYLLFKEILQKILKNP